MLPNSLMFTKADSVKASFVTSSVPFVLVHDLGIITFLPGLASRLLMGPNAWYGSVMKRNQIDFFFNVYIFPLECLIIVGRSGFHTLHNSWSRLCDSGIVLMFHGRACKS